MKGSLIIIFFVNKKGVNPITVLSLYKKDTCHWLATCSAKLVEARTDGRLLCFRPKKVSATFPANWKPEQGADVCPDRAIFAS